MKHVNPQPALRAKLAGMGVWGPGFSNMQDLAAVFAGKADGVDEDAATPKPEMIPPRERRRAPLSVKGVVEVASQACEAAGVAPADAACVFASGMGDTSITDYMCRTLASQPALISPTKFHNSVHNAAAGYWSISSACHQAANSISAFEYSVGMTLLEALGTCAIEQRPVLVVNVDIPTRPPMRDIHVIDQAFAGAILLLPANNASGVAAGGLAGHLEGVLDYAADSPWPDIECPALKPLYQRNPAARMLALCHWWTLDSQAPLQLPLSKASSLRLTKESA